MNNLALIRTLIDRPMWNRLDSELSPLMRSVLGYDPTMGVSPQNPATIPFWPNVEIRETTDSLVCLVDVPGVKEKDISVSLAGNQLTITGSREIAMKDTSDSVYLVERSYGSFKRTLPLPESVDGAHVTARLDDGVLSIVLPKKTEHAARKIVIKATPKSHQS